MPPKPFTCGITHSLGKFFADSPVPRKRRLRLSGLRGEVLSLQIIYRWEGEAFKDAVSVRVSGALAERTRLRRVGYAHVEFPTYGEDPEALIGRAPGYYPDPLFDDETFPLALGQTRGVWVSVELPEDAPGGPSRMDFEIVHGEKVLGRLAATVEVVPAPLPKQELDVIHWFHNDCLMSHYGCEAWSKEHWRIVEPYLRDCAGHGSNVITTPVFTPPLDTAVGTERPTCQLVDVTVTAKDTYRFGFRKLERWIDLCRRCGANGFEISHLATQWGANAAPKIVANVGGRTKRIFGWDTPSTGSAYRRFLAQFLPSLVRCLKEKRALSRSFFHVSDEPGLACIEQYGAVRDILREVAPEITVIEALSNLDFFERGCVDIPIPASNHVEPFLEAGVAPLWTYYCCGQRHKVSNRFMDFPSARNRILGWQLFKFAFTGFLQWGYNYWYRDLLDVLVDPYTEVHSGKRILPSGDAFVVYPGPDGPVDSLRWEVFREALQDLRALRLLRELAGEKPAAAARRLLELPDVRSMADAPYSPEWILGAREKVNAAIKRRLNGGKRSNRL